MDLAEEKLLLVLFAISVVTGVTFASIHFPAIQGVFSTFVGGIVSLVAVYCGANLTGKYVDNKFGGDEPHDDLPPHPPRMDG